MLLKLEDKTPPVYCRESRDFQLFLRLYNAVNNAVIDDTANLLNLTDSRRIKTELLPLLQTKVGFFSNYNVNSEMLRYILAAFPDIVKNKGSIEGIKQAVRVYLKVANVKTDLQVYCVTKSGEKGGVYLEDHTIVIGINNTGDVHDLYILEELLKYILPVGYSYFFYFFEEYREDIRVDAEQKAFSFVVGQNINSSPRFLITPESCPEFNKFQNYPVDALVRYDGKIYKCINAYDSSTADLTGDGWQASYWYEMDAIQDSTTQTYVASSSPFATADGTALDTFVYVDENPKDGEWDRDEDGNFIDKSDSDYLLVQDEQGVLWQDVLVNALDTILIYDSRFEDLNVRKPVINNTTIIQQGICGKENGFKWLLDSAGVVVIRALKVGEQRQGDTLTAFKDSIKILSIDESVQSSDLDSESFAGCKNLTEVSLPNSFESIPAGWFANCTKLTSILIPDNVMTIGAGAFEGCTSLKNIMIGNGLREIGTNAFNKCTNLTDLYYSGDEDAWERIRTYDSKLKTINKHFRPVNELTETMLSSMKDASAGSFTSSIRIIQQPTPSAIESSIGSDVEFSVEAFSVGTLKCEWQYSIDSGVTWIACTTDYTGANEKTLSFKAQPINNATRILYRCILSCGSETVETIPAELNITGE